MEMAGSSQAKPGHDEIDTTHERGPALAVRQQPRPPASKPAGIRLKGVQIMSTFNVVRFRVKAGHEDKFLNAHRGGKADWPGLLRGTMIKTGDQTYCLIGEWADASALANARSSMIATLDSFRDTLEDLGGGLGVTDAASGPVVLDLKM
jgi:hypothetical protein